MYVSKFTATEQETIKNSTSTFFHDAIKSLTVPNNFLQCSISL